MNCNNLKQQLLKTTIVDLKAAVSLLIGLDCIVELPNAERSAILNGGIHTLNEIILDEPIDLGMYDAIHLHSLARYCNYLAVERTKQGELLTEIMTSTQNIAANLMQHLINFESD